MGVHPPFSCCLFLLSSVFVVGFTLLLLKYQKLPQQEDRLSPASWWTCSVKLCSSQSFKEHTKTLFWDKTNKKKKNLGISCVGKAANFPSCYLWIFEQLFEGKKKYFLTFFSRQHATFVLTWLVSYIIPDVPASVSQLQLYENALIKKLRFDAAFKTEQKSDGPQQDKFEGRFNPYQASLQEDEIVEEDNEIFDWRIVLWTPRCADRG